MDYEEEEEMAGYLSQMDQREKEEMEFYTDLAVQEMQRWIEAVTRKKFKYSDDPKRSLADGIILCELLNGILPGTVKRINRLPTPMAGMDNLNVFIDASKRHFGLKEAQLFAPSDLQDFAERNKRDIELSPGQIKERDDKRLRNVAITIFWLARQVQGVYVGPELDFTNFTALVNAKTLSSSLAAGSSGGFAHQHQYSSSGDWTEPESRHSHQHSRTSSRDSYAEDMRRSSAGHAGRREGRSYSSSDSLDDLDGSGPGWRRKSSSALQPAKDPLQFIALKPAVNLAKKAEQQIEIVKETKKRRESVDKDEAEWQFNLSDWKNRRKSKSGSVLPERTANELPGDKYQEFERRHRDTEPALHKASLSSQSQYDEDEAFYSPGYHQVNISQQYQAVSSPSLSQSTVLGLGSKPVSKGISPSKKKIPPKVKPKPNLNRRHTIALDVGTVNQLLNAADGETSVDSRNCSVDSEDTTLEDIILHVPLSKRRSQSSDLLAYTDFTSSTDFTSAADFTTSSTDISTPKALTVETVALRDKGSSGSKTKSRPKISDVDGLFSGSQRRKTWASSNSSHKVDLSSILRVSAIDPPVYKAADSLIQTFGSRQQKAWRPVPAPRRPNATQGKSSSEDNSSSREYEDTPESSKEFKPLADDISSSPLDEIIERATIIPVQSKPLQSASLRSTTDQPASLRSTAGSLSNSMVKSKMRVQLETEVGNDDGFGFTIKGGKDKCLPITIETVVNDSAADQAELLEGDEVLEINDEVITERNRGYCMLLINGSLQKNGKLNVFIKRDPSKIPSAAKERKQHSQVVRGKSILDMYDNLESSVDTDDTQDGGMHSHERGGSKDMEKMDEEFTRREMEREYRSILDGGYDSAVSTLRSELTLEDRQAYLDSHPHLDIQVTQQQEKITPTIVHAAYTSPSSEYVSAAEYNTGSRAESTSEESNREQTNSTRDIESDEEESMQAFEQNYDKVTKDFESVAPPLASQHDLRFQSRSKQMNDDNRRRMEEWQKQQDRRQQDEEREEQYEKEQQEIQRQVEKSRLEAEESVRNRQILSDASSPPPQEEDNISDRVLSPPPSSLRQSLSNAAKEKETRDKAVQRLLDIKARYSRDALSNDNNNQPDKKSSPLTSQSQSLHSAAEEDSDDDFARYRIKEPESRSSPSKASVADTDEMRDRHTANYYDYKPVDVTQPKETPSLSDVYKYYDEDVPSNLGERDPSPPPMTRKDVMNMNKKSTPWQDTNELPAEVERPWERREVIAPVIDVTPAPAAAVSMRRNNFSARSPDKDRRKSAPSQPRWNSQEYEDPSSKRQSDIDPSLPSTLRKEDVLKMTREKARFSQPRRASEVPARTQPINHKNGGDEADKPPKRNSKGFFSNRAMFEQQSREADRQFAEQQERRHSAAAKPKPAPLKKAMTITTQAPSLSKQNRSKSMDVRPPALNRGDVVKGQDVSDAAYERMKELAIMKQLREAETEQAEQDEQERRNRDKRLRDERQRELAEIRKLNQQYEQQRLEEEEESHQQQDYNKPANRTDELNAARKRMAREAEELARAQIRHDQDIKAVHGVDMQAERRQRELANLARGPTNGRVYDEDEDEEEDQRHERELSSLDRNEREQMARKRHQEMIEQSRRDQQRREEARQIEQRQQADRRPRHEYRQPSIHSTAQQQHNDEWRPEQQPQRTTAPQQQQPKNYSSRREPTSQYNKYSQPPPRDTSRQQPPMYGSNNSPQKAAAPMKASSPERRLPSTSSQSSASPVDNYARYEDNFAAAGPPPVTNGYDARRGSSHTGAPQPARGPKQNDAAFYGNKGGYGQPALPKQQEKQSTQPLYNHKPQGSVDRSSLPKPYQRQEPLGHNMNPRHQDSSETRPPTQDRLYNNHPRQDSYERNPHSGYSSSSNDGYSDSRPSYDYPQGYRAPQPSNNRLPCEDPRYGNGNPPTFPTTNNNNDSNKRDKYIKDRSPEPQSQSSSRAITPPSKPARVPNSKPRSEEDEPVTVSAKYMCAYCTQELGKGAAMVIESLGLYYHTECFRCCVCHSLLSNGQMGADVRVRGNRLHCKNCYSNDDAGIKYSAV